MTAFGARHIMARGLAAEGGLPAGRAREVIAWAGLAAAAVLAAGCAGPLAPSPRGAEDDNPFGRFVVGVGSVVTFPWALWQQAREAEAMDRLKAIDRAMEQEILERSGPRGGDAAPPPGASPGVRGLHVVRDHAAEGDPPAQDPLSPNGLIILEDHLAPAPPAPEPSAGPGGP